MIILLGLGKVMMMMMMITKTTMMPTGTFACVAVQWTVDVADQSGKKQIMRGAEMVAFQKHKFEQRVVAEKFPKLTESRGRDNGGFVSLLRVGAFEDQASVMNDHHSRDSLVLLEQKLERTCAEGRIRDLVVGMVVVGMTMPEVRLLSTCVFVSKEKYCGTDHCYH